MNFFKGIHLSRTNLKRKTTNEGPKRRSAGQSLTYRPFDNSEFNFTKVADDELIGTFGSGAHAVLVNVSPLAYGHCLLCPNYKDCRPQILSLDALSAAVAFQRSANGERSDMQVTFNSLGAWASVNHLHFHVFWPAGRHPSHSETAGELEGRILDSGGRLILLEQPLFGKMPIELAAPKRVLAKFEYLTLEELDYPAYTFRVTAVGEDGVNLMAAGIWSVVWVLLRLDIPHNIVLSQRATVAFVTPRQPQMISFMQEGFSDGAGLHIACAELGGYIICFDQETYECLTEEDVVRIFGRDINLEDPRMVEEVVASFNRCAV
ncbi:GDP-D-glucose phosphorylase [Perkinsus chesapeaki]|uniref:GDP-D-glucose phosphorylase 1 n=1 Tax=Perkinsus chesapeaki TaxID=330153 RepID=A0A7J6MUM8_PERCH|nr:GDP-D-glucose phosphorylase [Perkinsus chesapeaki]